MGTLDDLLWSIVAKERTGQKARLTKMIPGLVLGLRKGCVAVAAPADKSKAFFDALYPLHVAAIKPPPAEAPASAEAEHLAARDTESPLGIDRGRPALNARNVHDYVSEMAVGTWLVFKHEDGAAINARLTWVSPRRTRYIFTSRSRREALMFSPEELAWELAAKRASLLLEPVPALRPRRQRGAGHAGRTEAGRRARRRDGFPRGVGPRVDADAIRSRPATTRPAMGDNGAPAATRRPARPGEGPPWQSTRHASRD